MVGLLPLSYRKAFENEKFVLRIFSAVLFLGLVFVLGIIFLLPSYFSLVFSLDDVLRRFEAEETSLKRKDIEGLESKISYINSLTDSYVSNESKRKSFASILFSLTNAVPAEIKLLGIEFQLGSGNEFVFHIRGEAERRSALIVYSQKLREIPEIKEVHSPISNLLSDTDIRFLLETTIKPEYYENQN